MSKEYSYSLGDRKILVSREVQAYLNQSDRRIRYHELDIKIERPVYDKNKQVTGFRPSKEVSMTLLTETGVEFKDSSIDVEEAAIGSVMRKNLRQALETLDAEAQQLLQLRYFDGLSQTQCSAILGIPQSTVSHRERKLLARLHKLLGK